jgi:inner membrane protein
MASAFGHAFAAITLGNTFPDKMFGWKFWALGIFCSIVPDIDVVGFVFGIPYNSFWGHRGFTHSFLFAIILGVVVTAIFYRKYFFSKAGLFYILFFTLNFSKSQI